MSKESKVLEFLRKSRSELIDLIAELVELESPSSRPDLQGGVFSIIERELKALGFHCKRLSGRSSGGQMLAGPCDRKKGQPIVLIMGHVDTVWPVGTLQTMPLKVEENRISGPGVFDMKSGIASVIFALRALQNAGLSYSETPVIFLNSDEETGSHDSTYRIERLARIAKRVLVVEPAAGLDGRIKTERMGVAHFRITAHGKAAHAGLDPKGGASAILEMAHHTLSLFKLSERFEGVHVNVGKVKGGSAGNVIAAECSVIVDVRVASLAVSKLVEAEIFGLRAILPGVWLEIEPIHSRPPMEKTEASEALWQEAKRKASVLGFALKEASVGGGSDGNTTSQFAPTLDGLGAVGDGAHALHEFVDIDKLIERSALLAMLVGMEA